MSSCFVPTPIKIRGFAGKKYTDHTLMQFVPGIVKHVVTAKSSLRATTNNAERNINSIIAKPHVFEGNMPRDEDLYHEKFRYFPLLRGMVDVPTKGDPVLLCTFGGINYYLGPLNTENNPNYNKDNLDKPDPLPGKVTQAISGKVTDATESKNKPKNFKFKPFPRMEKKVNHSLDTPIGGTGRREVLSETLNEVHGDMIFEGRHGNSIRIGSRNEYPYLYISNGRSIVNEHESIGDGSLIGITSYGTLKSHFGSLHIDNEEIAIEKQKLQTMQLLTSDVSITNKRPIIKTYNIIKRMEQLNLDPKKTIYGYNSNQIFITSDRLIFSSKQNDIYMSTPQDIFLGAAGNVSISTGSDFIIESRKTYFGLTAMDDGQPMVLGNILVDILKELLEVLKHAGSNVHFPLPLGVLNTYPKGGGEGKDKYPVSLAEYLSPIEQKLERLLSHHHFIEPNDVIK